MLEILTVGTDTSLLNLLLFMDQGWTEDKNLLRNWVKKKKNFGQQNVSEDRIDTATEQITASRIGASIAVWTERTSTMRGHARIQSDRDEWLLVTLALGEIMMSEERCCAVTNHSSIIQMKRDYGLIQSPMPSGACSHQRSARPRAER